MSIIPLSETITSNGTYNYEAGSVNADGFSPVSLTVNVPTSSSQVPIDRIHLSSSSSIDSSFFILLLSDMTYTSSTLSVSIPASQVLITINQTSTSYLISYLENDRSTSITSTVFSDTYYFISSTLLSIDEPYLIPTTSSNTPTIAIHPIFSDQEVVQVYFFKTLYYFDFS